MTEYTDAEIDATLVDVPKLLARIAALESTLAKYQALSEAVEKLDKTGAIVRLDNSEAPDEWEAEYEDHEFHRLTFPTLSAALIAMAKEIDHE